MEDNISGGYVKVFRKIFDSGIWKEKPFSRGQAWIDLILLANHKPGYFRVRGVRVDVKRGQVGTSSKSLSTRWGWSRGKVLRFLNELEVEQQIVQQKNNVTTLIDIVNYDMYQGDGTQTGQQTGRKRDANGHKQEGKEGKEEKTLVGKPKKQASGKFATFWKAYPNKQGKARAAAFWKRNKLDREYSDIMESLARYKLSDQWTRDGGRFIPHGSTWICQRRWEDEVEVNNTPGEKTWVRAGKPKKH